MPVMDILEKLFVRGESEIASSFKKRQNGFDSCDHTRCRLQLEPFRFLFKCLENQKH